MRGNILHISFITIIVALCSWNTGYSQTTQNSTPLQKQLEAIVTGEVLGESVVGICVRTGDGRTLADISAGTMLAPASNMKLISTGAAVHSLGDDYRFYTSIGYDGDIIEGTLMGNIYILGGGDPTLGSKDTIATPLESIFGQWEKMIREAGIREIDGMVIGASGDFFSGMAEEHTWQWNDVGTYYGAGTTGLMFYENMQSFNVTAGKSVGDSLMIAPSYPQTPWMEFRYDCSTGKEGTGDQLYMYTSGLSPVAEIRGTFAVDRKPKRLDCSNKFPEITCAHYFTQWLQEHGINCIRGASDDRLNGAQLPDSLRILGKSESPTLRRIIYEANHQSNNLYAETLLRVLGKELRNDGCYDSCYVAINDVIKEMGVDVSRGYRMQDGSGLSRQNFVSADFFCRFLVAMMSSPQFETYIESLPSPGGAGTLSQTMKNYPAELKARIKAKSGSMTGVRCCTGYIIPKEGCKDDAIVFSIMINNCTAPTWKVRSVMDKIMGLIAGAN